MNIKILASAAFCACMAAFTGAKALSLDNIGEITAAAVEASVTAKTAPAPASVAMAPGDVVMKLLAAIQAGDSNLATLNELCTEETAAMLSFALAAMEEDDRKEMQSVKFSVVKTNITGDKAQVVVCAKEPGDAEGDEETFELVKTGGKWKVGIDK